MYSILIIEDDSSYRYLMEVVLREEGFDVRTASTGQSGLTLLRENRPSLILCDIMMPNMDGYMVLETLKNDPDHVDIPFIFVTAMANLTDVRKGMLGGADDYLPKPFTAEELLAAVTVRILRTETILHGAEKNVFLEERTILRTKLTKQERKILLMVGRGITSKKIAVQLEVCLKTIEMHRANMMKKLHATNVASLTRWAVIAEQMERDSE